MLSLLWAPSQGVQGALDTCVCKCLQVRPIGYSIKHVELVFAYKGIPIISTKSVLDSFTCSQDFVFDVILIPQLQNSFDAV